MARTYPCTDEDFSGITGVGRKKLENFGGEFIAVIQEYVDAEGIKKTEHQSTVKPAKVQPVASIREREDVTFYTYETAVKPVPANLSVIQADEKLAEDAIELQKRVDQLSKELESAKKSLDDAMKKLKHAEIAGTNQ